MSDSSYWPRLESAISVKCRAARRAVGRDFSRYLRASIGTHVALIALIDEEGASVIGGGARCVGLAPGKAEVALAVVDRYRGMGIGPARLRQLAAMVRANGRQELVAEVLLDNTPMLKLLERSGFPVTKRRK